MNSDWEEHNRMVTRLWTVVGISTVMICLVILLMSR